MAVPAKLRRRRFLEKPAERFWGDTFRSARARGFLLEDIARRHKQFESRGILARQPLDDCIRCLTLTRVEYLYLPRIRVHAHRGSLAVKNHRRPNACPILVISQSSHQRVTRERGAASMQTTQLRPGKNHAMTIDDEVLRAHSVLESISAESMRSSNNLECAGGSMFPVSAQPASSVWLWS